MKDTDFSEVHNAQVTAIAAAIAQVPTENIKIFDQASINTAIREPYLLLEAAEISVDQNAKGSAGQMWVRVNYQAHCILSRAVDNVAIECLNFAALVMKVVNKNKWGLANVGAPEELSAFPGKYSEGPQGFDSWIVSWWQTVAIGDSWQLNTQVPEAVLLSEAPAIGEANRDNYQELDDGFISSPTA